MKKIILIASILMLVGLPYLHADNTLSENYGFPQLLAFDANSADGKITPQTQNIALGVTVKNNATERNLRFTSFNINSVGIRKLSTGESVSDKIVALFPHNPKIGVIPPRSTVVVNKVTTAALKEGLEPGQYIVSILLNFSVPQQTNPASRMEAIITVE